MDKKALRTWLTGRRALISPERHGIVREARQGRRAVGLSQGDIDDLLHRGRGTYARLESGRYPNPPVDLLRGVATLLEFDDEQDWKALWWLATGQDPPGPLFEDAGREVHAGWQEVVNSCSQIAYVTNRSWEMLAHNEACVGMFPRGEVPANVMEWMLTNVEARTVLADWAECWAPVVAPQLRAAVAALPEDVVLQRLEKQVLADPEAGPIYEAVDDVHIHPDGCERPFSHPLHGPGWVTLCASEPAGAPRARIMFVLYRPGPHQGAGRPALRAG